MTGSNATTRRRGLISVALVTGLMILILLAGGLVRLIYLRDLELAMSANRLQAEWLAESGADRASAKLSQTQDYKGEDWTIPATDLGGRTEGRVMIRVDPNPGHDNQRKVVVHAWYPGAGPRRASQSLELTINLTSPDSTKPTTNPDRKGDAPK